MSKDDSEHALDEHRFWLQILGDHARFIHNGLAPREHKEIERATHFIDAFDRLLKQANQGRIEDLNDLTENAFRVTIQLREFKLHLLRKHLTRELAIQLPPTFINHMVNELEEYLRLLECFQKGQNPPFVHPVHHHLLWLSDAAGHSAIIANLVDPVEKRLIQKSDAFSGHFETYYLKAVELAGYLRARMERFPALARFNQEVELEIRLFSDFLHEIEEMELSNTLLGALSPLLPDHMAREECYYLTKLAEVAETKAPSCNPAAPRHEDYR